jgi:hypothetical protein
VLVVLVVLAVSLFLFLWCFDFFVLFMLLVSVLLDVFWAKMAPPAERNDKARAAVMILFM